MSNHLLHRHPILAGAAIAILASGCSQRAEHEPSAETPASVSARLATVSMSPSAEIYEVRGNVLAELRTTMSTKAMGRVVSVGAREGDLVRRGQILAVLDSRELSANVAIARANLRASQVSASNVATAAQMERKLSEARIRQAEAALEQARSGVESAKAKLSLALAGPRTQEKAQASLR